MEGYVDYKSDIISLNSIQRTLYNERNILRCKQQLHFLLEYGIIYT